MSPDLKLSAHKVLIFDVYGTLVDWESGIYNKIKSIFPKDTPREKVLETYAVVELDLQVKYPSVAYSKILHLAWLRLSAQAADMDTGRGGAAAVTEEDESEAERFGASISTWEPFEDTAHALHRLKEHFALVVLSNVDNKSFDGTHELLKSTSHDEARKSRYPTITPDSPFSLVLTAQQVGAYKPDPRALEAALKQVSCAPSSLLPHPSPPLAVEPGEVLMVANSLQHDVEPANLRNINSVWISRHEKSVIGTKAELKEKCMWTWRFETLRDLADAIDQEIGEAPDATT